MIDNSTIGYSLEGCFVLIGLCILIVHFVRRRRRPAELPVYRLPQRTSAIPDVMFFFAALVIPMGLAFGSATLAAKYRWEWGSGRIQLGATYVQEFAMIAVILLYTKFWRPPDQISPALTEDTAEVGGARPPGALAPTDLEPVQILPALKTGLITFLAAMPLVFLVAAAWQGILTLCNIPPAHQTIVDMFLGFTTPGMIILFIIVAAVLVPLCEEMIFRGGLFRGLRTAIPRPYAIIISAVVFGAAHGDLTAFFPLVTLGVVFAIAYERTGNIGTVIVAHALFNLNTLVALLLGVNA